MLEPRRLVTLASTVAGSSLASRIHSVPQTNRSLRSQSAPSAALDTSRLYYCVVLARQLSNLPNIHGSSGLVLN
ncbi:hypothetical protein BDW68DRAFT_169131 [Aspergillus falconensis]